MFCWQNHHFMVPCVAGFEAFIECVAACRIVRVLDWPQIRRVRPWRLVMGGTD
jgi:hypothetical protein